MKVEVAFRGKGLIAQVACRSFFVDFFADPQKSTFALVTFQFQL